MDILLLIILLFLGLILFPFLMIDNDNNIKSSLEDKKGDNNELPQYSEKHYRELKEEYIQYQKSILECETYPERDTYFKYKDSIKVYLKEVNEILTHIPSENYFDGDNGLLLLHSLSVRRLYNEFFKENNYSNILEQYINNATNKYKLLLDDIDGKSLDMQQREAVIADEQNNLVIAGAGSGKTLTIAGKVKYLCTAKNIKPEEILLITFTKKAAEEMSERVVNRLGFKVDVKTFHSLGYELVGQLSGNKPSVLDNVSKIYSTFLSKELFKDFKLQYTLFTYLSLYMRENISLDKYNEIGDYYKALQCVKTETIKSKIEKFKEYKKKYKISTENNISDKKINMSKTMITYQKEQVKSYEELLIANYLFLNGIEYEYETNYKYQTLSENKRQYKPDFYLPKYDVYIEHFGIDKDGRCNQYSYVENIKYMESIEWKRQIHKKYGTILEETYSYERANNTLFKKLDKIFEKYNITVSPIDEKSLNNYLEVLKTDNDFLEFFSLINTFLTLFKANNYKQADIEIMKNKGLSLLSRINPFQVDKHKLFFIIFERYYNFYQSYLSSKQEIDFNDMINIGTELVLNNPLPDKYNYKYIIIDEYQDISVARFNLIKAIKEKTNAKIMAVGDDWQSIYRFAGSDINLFTKFEKYFGTTYISKIEKTYRNGQSLIDIAGDFVMKNPNQIVKKLISNKKLKHPIQYIDMKEKYKKNMNYPLDYLDFVLKKISSEYIKKDKNLKAEIMILGRNNSDLENLFNESVVSSYNDKYTVSHDSHTGSTNIIHSDYNNLKIKYLSVHKSKGLEADEVVIINNYNTTAGFPNLMVDDSILHYVLTAPEKYEYAEERRLFYVALTRTKNKCYLLLPQDPSVFILEMINSYNIKNIVEKKVNNEDELSLVDQSCPVCSTGKMKVRIDNSTKEKFYGCSNYPYCNYTVNLEIINRMEEIIRCPKCNSFMVKRYGKYGEFYGCLNYPYCKHTSEIVKDNTSQINQKDSKLPTLMDDDVPF